MLKRQFAQLFQATGSDVDVASTDVEQVGSETESPWIIPSSDDELGQPDPPQGQYDPAVWDELWRTSDAQPTCPRPTGPTWKLAFSHSAAFVHPDIQCTCCLRPFQSHTHRFRSPPLPCTCLTDFVRLDASHSHSQTMTMAAKRAKLSAESKELERVQEAIEDVEVKIMASLSSNCMEESKPMLRAIRQKMQQFCEEVAEFRGDLLSDLSTRVPEPKGHSHRP